MQSTHSHFDSQGLGAATQDETYSSGGLNDSTGREPFEDPNVEKEIIGGQASTTTTTSQAHPIIPTTTNTFSAVGHGVNTVDTTTQHGLKAVDREHERPTSSATTTGTPERTHTGRHDVVAQDLHRPASAPVADTSETSTVGGSGIGVPATSSPFASEIKQTADEVKKSSTAGTHNGAAFTGPDLGSSNTGFQGNKDDSLKHGSVEDKAIVATTGHHLLGSGEREGKGNAFGENGDLMRICLHCVCIASLTISSFLLPAGRANEGAVGTKGLVVDRESMLAGQHP